MIFKSSHLYIFTILSTILWITACLSQNKEAHLSGHTKASPLLSAQERIIFVKPKTPITKSSLKIKDMLALVPGLDKDLNNYELFIDHNIEGETFLWGKDKNGYMAIMSIDANQKIWALDTAVVTKPGNNEDSIELLASGLVYKRAFTEIPQEISDTIPMLIIPQKNTFPKLAIATDTINLTNKTLYRLDNTFMDADFKENFSFKEIAPKIWRLEGDFYGSLVCSGSVFWQDSKNTWISLSHRFNTYQHIRWQEENETLIFQALETNPKLFPDYTHLTQPCSINGTTQAEKWLESIEYNNLVSINHDQPTTLPLNIFKWGNEYPLGTIIHHEDTTWFVMESRPQLGFYRVLNHGRIPAEDRGKRMQRVFEIYQQNFKIKMKEIAKTQDFLVISAEVFDELSHERIRAQEASSTIQRTANNKLKVAEVRANVAGAGWNEWYKPVTRILGNAAADKMLDPKFAAGGEKLFGLSPSKASIQGAITTVGVPVKNKIAAFFAYTLIEATLNATSPLIVNLQKGDSENALKALRQSFTSTGFVNAARGIASLTPNPHDDFMMTIGSGLVLRWRKIRMDEAVGYENFNQILNIAAGGLTTYLQIKAINARMMPGQVRALGRGGILLSDIIAGRGYPGVIIGGLGEMTVDLLVVHPAIRPFANTLSTQVSALIQIYDAQRSLNKHGDALERTRQLHLSQASLYNSMAYILKTQPEILTHLSYIDQETVITVMSDPYKVIRSHFKTSE